MKRIKIIEKNQQNKFEKLKKQPVVEHIFIRNCDDRLGAQLEKHVGGLNLKNKLMSVGWRWGVVLIYNMGGCI